MSTEEVSATRTGEGWQPWERWGPLLNIGDKLEQVFNPAGVPETMPSIVQVEVDSSTEARVDVRLEFTDSGSIGENLASGESREYQQSGKFFRWLFITALTPGGTTGRYRIYRRIVT